MICPSRLNRTENRGGETKCKLGYYNLQTTNTNRVGEVLEIPTCLVTIGAVRPGTEAPPRNLSPRINGPRA